KKLAGQLDVPFLGEIPLVKSISESGDAGRPVVLDDQNPMSKAFNDMAQRVAQQVAISNAGANNKSLVNNS
ncbi:MAG TPA: P-loop NTPase, partial [Mucilaginibacter sp.]|nr:P-loop NTPase [Mucilaginibacter sp.]